MRTRSIAALALVGLVLPATPAEAALANVGTVALGAGSLHLDLNATTNRLYVTVGTALRVVDTVTQTLTASVAMQALDVAVNELTNRVYVTQQDRVAVLDGSTLMPLAPAAVMVSPYGVAVDELRNRVFVADHSGPLKIFDGSTMGTVATIPGFTSHHVTIDPSFSRVYATTLTAPYAVKVIDPVSFSILQTLSLPAAGHDPFLAAELGRLYVPTSGGTQVFSTPSGSLVGSRPGTTHGAVSPLTRIGYVSNTSQILGFDAATLASTSTIAPGGNGLSIDARRNRIYVADGPDLRIYSDIQPSFTSAPAITAAALDPIPVAATVRSSSMVGIPGMTVQFTRGVDVATGITDGNGVATATLPPLASGSYTVSISASGTGWITSNTVTPLTVNRRPTALTLTGAASGIRGQTVSITARLQDTATGNGIASTPVQFTLGSLTGSATTNAGGYATWTPSLMLTPGSYTLSASTTASVTHAAATTSRAFQVTWEYTYTDVGGRGRVFLNTITDEFQVETAAGSSGIVAAAGIRRIQTAVGIEMLALAYRSAAVGVDGTFRVGDGSFAAVAVQGTSVTPLAAPPSL